MKKVLVFDMGGVIMNIAPKLVLEKFSVLLGDNLAKLGFGSNGEGSELMEQFECGFIDEQAFFQKALELSVPDTTLANVREAWMTMHQGIPSVRFEKLRKLKARGYTMYLLSNNNQTHWQDIMDNYKLESIFDGFFLSHIEHCSKPGKEIFQHLMDRTGANANDILFIDDLQANREAAEALGWSTAASIDEAIHLIRE